MDLPAHFIMPMGEDPTEADFISISNQLTIESDPHKRRMACLYLANTTSPNALPAQRHIMEGAELSADVWEAFFRNSNIAVQCLAAAQCRDPKLIDAFVKGDGVHIEADTVLLIALADNYNTSPETVLELYDLGQDALCRYIDHLSRNAAQKIRESKCDPSSGSIDMIGCELTQT